MTVTTTGSRTASTDRWRDAFAALDRQCPWPGPRPLALEDVEELGDAQHVLVGRERDRKNFLREIDTGHRLVFLTGQSGVGKTSLLQVGLVPVLREHGYRVAVCRDWTRDDQSASPAEFLAAKIRGQLLPDLPDLAEGPEMFWQLNSAGGVVLVLDQFEELLRWDRPMQRGIFALITDLNQAAPDIKLVVSFRSEFLHEMRPLENAARAFSMSHFALEPLDPSYALALITAPNRGGREFVTQGAAATIAARWRAAVQAPDAGGPAMRGSVGLLHLQALLYELHAASPVGVITQELLDDRPADPVGLFVDGLARAADVKLGRCRRASEDAGPDVDRYLLEGTTDLLARSVRNLSSYGYKLVRDVVDLASATFGDQLDNLVSGVENTSGDLAPEQLRALIGALVNAAFGVDSSVDDLLAVDRAEIARRADALTDAGVVTTWTERLAAGSGDPTGITSGPMLGMAPAAVLVEEMRRFVFALVWLAESSLVRLSRPGRDTMVSLVHDGFGAALATWSAAVSSRPDGALHALTAARGAYFDWDRIEDAVIVNLRWRGNTITADLARVTFVNCDFRGTLFLKCQLNGVSFVNCMLDGAMFSDCTVRGALSPATGPISWQEPTFVVPAPDSVVAALARYRGEAGPARWLLSPSQGEPATAVAVVPAARAGFLGEPGAVPGGIAVIGGRVSSFMLRRCTVEAGSMVSFRHVAGSGLDIVEQNSGRFEVYGSALRHVSVTTTLRPPDDDHVEIVATESLLAQSWFGDKVVGTFHAVDCRLVQVWNGSPSLAATALRSVVTGCVGIEDDGGCAPLGGADGLLRYDVVDPTGAMRDATARMDYRVYGS